MTGWEAAAALAGKPSPAWASPDGKSEFGFLPETQRELAEASGMAYYPHQKKQWLRETRIWMGMGATPDAVRRAAKLHEERKLSTHGPKSIEWAIEEVLNGDSKRSGETLHRTGTPPPSVKSARTAGEF